MKIKESMSLGEGMDRILKEAMDRFVSNYHYSTSNRDRIVTEAYAQEFIESVAAKNPSAKEFWTDYFRKQTRNGSQ